MTFRCGKIRKCVASSGAIARATAPAVVLAAALAVGAMTGGCDIGGLGSYSNEWLYPRDVSTVYVEMFDSRSFRRGYEYVLTDAICKRIEAETPYKIVSDRDLADTVMGGQLSVSVGALAWERYRGIPLEMESTVAVSVSWKNLSTGKLLINNEIVTASAPYSTQLTQDIDYATNLAVNRAAQKVVELMEITW